MSERPPVSAAPAVPLHRRRQRSVRVTVAVSLLCLSTLLVTGALLVGSRWAAVTASVLVLLAGWASVRILVNEIAQTRRDAARDRAKQAQAYRAIFTQRVTEHDNFAASMTERVSARDSEILELQDTIGVTAGLAAEARAQVRAESQRAVQLQDRLEELTRELEDERADADSLACWDGTDAPTVVDMLAWEERASASSESHPRTRKQA